MGEVRLVPMTSEQLTAYRTGAVQGFADEFGKASGLSAEAALAESERQFQQLLPEGAEAPGQFLFSAFDGDAEVGIIWVHLRDRGGSKRAWIYDIEVRPEMRRHGYGRQMLLAAEEFSRDRGATAIELNVFGHNTGARALYEEIGYETVAIQMKKSL